MDTISNAINSVKATLYERISNPLLSSFIISWSIWNYKFILVILSSSMNTVEKFDYIKNSLYPFSLDLSHLDLLIITSNIWTAIDLFLGPILTTLVYLYYIFPLIGKKVFEDHKEHIREYEDIRVNIEGKTAMSNENVILLKSELRTIRGTHLKELDDKDTDIKSLEQAIDKISTNNSELKAELLKAINEIKEFGILKDKYELKIKELQSYKDNLSLRDIDKSIANSNKNQNHKMLKDDCGSLLIALSKFQGPAYLSQFKQQTTMHKLRFDRAINHLVKSKYVEADLNQEPSQRTFQLTNKGEEYLLENSLI